MEKFEVFISFKNTDKNGEKTQDSVMAEELYYALKKKGISAFYSNISIPEYGEHRFGNMINDALEQCSIFVAVGTSIENLKSQWVKYEIESFHGEILNGNKAYERSAMYSYVTKNVATNKLPMELRRCQACLSLQEIVNCICARFRQEKDILKNFAPEKIATEEMKGGSLIDGKYEILAPIGRGGMSVVYLARDIRLNRNWALKVVRKEGVREFEVIKQSLNAEIDLLKKFNHPNLPRIIDVLDNEDSYAVIMDYIEGIPLNEVLKKSGSQLQEHVIGWAKQLCDVLRYLHTRTPAIIYRDLKPSNIILRPDGRIALIDFGTAREFKETNIGDTTLLGTMGYAAPEQFGGLGQTDARTDIYCLGVTMYHLLTNVSPCDPPYEMRPIREIDPYLSCGMQYIIQRCTFRNPEKRYQSAQELLYDLEHIEKLDKVEKRKESFSRVFHWAGAFEKTSKKKDVQRDKKEDRSFVVPTNVVVPPPPVPVVSAKHLVKPIPMPPTVVPNHCNNETSVLGVPCDDATTLLEMPSNNKTTVFVATTSVSKLEQNTEIEVCFYLVSDDDEDIMNKLTLKDLERDNLIGSKSFSIDEAEEINVDLQSDDILFNRHRLKLSMEKRMDSVRAIKSILRKDEVCPVVHVQIKCKEKLCEEFKIEYKS